MTISEAGIIYSMTPSRGAKEYIYTHYYVPKGTRFSYSVWCYSENDFYTLLGRWNRDYERWRYWPGPIV